MDQDHRFKPYQQHQTLLFPPNIEELVPQDHPARIVSHVIEQINLQPLFEQYPGGGASAHHPRMLLKVIVLGYISNIFSSRRIAQACRESIPFAWITAQQQLDHNTINRFRTQRLEKPLRTIFTQVVFLLAKHGVLSLRKELYIDGTKIEANANRYTFVWGKAIKTNKQKLQKQLDELWSYAQQVAKEELNSTPAEHIDQIAPKDLAKTIHSINEALKGKPVDKKVKQKLYRAKKEWPARLERYNKQEAILDGRNSYSTTDPDATFMRTKDDHLGNGQLKACYNLQIGTHRQYVLDYSIHQTPGDTTTLPSQIASYKQAYGVLPASVVADAGYSSEENYEYLAKQGIAGYIKDQLYDQEQKKRWQERHAFHPSRLYYAQESDVYYCPMGQPMQFKGTQKSKTKTGYQSTYRLYEACNCQGCPLGGACHKSQGNRLIKVNTKLNKYKSAVRSRLDSDWGNALYKKRNVEVESVFGNIKQNKGFRRFLLRGKEKVELEIGLVCLSHNLKKLLNDKKQKQSAKRGRLAA